jgi:alpha/beta superfamily hydrolase
MLRRTQDERAVTISMGEALGEAGLALEGLFVAAQGPSGGAALIAPPHPLFGGSMDSPVVSELAWACTKVGLSSLRFNWRGVGGSAGVPSGALAAADADYAAALEHLAETVSGELIACGYSFGAVAAARIACSEPRVRRVVLIAPPPDPLGAETLKDLNASLLLLAGKLDPIAPLERLEELVAPLGHARLVPIPEADHVFSVGLAELGALVTDWLRGG